MAGWCSSEPGLSVISDDNSYIAMTAKSNAKIGVKNTNIHLSCMQIDSAVILMLMGVEFHGTPLLIWVRPSENNKSTRIAPGFCPDSRRPGRRILYVFACLDNAERGQKDKQDCGIYFFRRP